MNHAIELPNPSVARLAMNDVLLATLGELVRKEVSAELLLTRIIDAMAKALGADRATVFWVDKAAGELISVAGHFPEVAQIRVPLAQGVAGYVARTGVTVNVPFSQEHVDIWRSVDNTTGYQTRTMLAGPLLDGDEVIGVVQFLNKSKGFFPAEAEFSMTQLAAKAALLLKETTLQRQTATEPDLALGEHFNRIVGSGEAMRQLFRAVRRVAPTQASVLLQGESGTGKTLLARAVHHNSQRANQPFVVVDCTTLPDALIENELFGHEKGAFTGADRRVIGKVAAADKGTLFFDEVGDLPLTLQGKLLTLLQDRTYSPVGSTKTQQADIRVIAATNRNLEALVAQGEFREDLFWRLKVVVLEMPPLRDREDLDALVDHFVWTMSRRHGSKVTGVTPEARAALRKHPWPGNVRELEHMVESAVIFCDDPEIGVADLRFGHVNARSNAFLDHPTMEELERRYITYLLRQNGGNRTECAKIMGIGRTTLIRKIAAFGLDE